MKKSLTKDEQYLLKFHQVALEVGDEFAEVDRYAIGKAVGLNERGIDALTRHLLQANFFKKGEGNNLYLTPNGLKLLQELKNE